MLVIGRKPGEYVLIGRDIKVEVVRSSQGELRLAIRAPSDMRIMRGELHQRRPMKQKNENAGPDQLEQVTLAKNYLPEKQAAVDEKTVVKTIEYSEEISCMDFSIPRNITIAEG